MAKAGRVIWSNVPSTEITITILGDASGVEIRSGEGVVFIPLEELEGVVDGLQTAAEEIGALPAKDMEG